jgi:hypothetical protein
MYAWDANVMEYDCLAMKNAMVNGKMKTDCDKK